MTFVFEILKEIWILFIEMSKYLMLGLSFVGILHVFFSKEMVARHIGNNSIWSIVKSAIFGVPLPLCSCGVVPTSIFLSKNGASKGSVISFLISTPQTGIDSIAATFGMMGGVFAVFRPLAAFVMGITGGIITRFFDKESASDIKPINVDQLHLEHNHAHVEESCSDGSCCGNHKSSSNKVIEMFRYAFVEFLDDIAGQFVIGLIIAGLISYFIPDNFFATLNMNSGILGMIAVILIGIPMYICATSSIPIAVSLMLKGFSPGVAFVFLAVGPATNAATIAVLLKVLGKKIVMIFLGTIIVLSIIFGYLLDFVYNLLDLDPISKLMQGKHHMNSLSWFDYTLAGIFLLLIILSIFRKYFGNKEEHMSNEVTKINVNGMTCNHCKMNVEKAVSSVDGVTSAKVILSDKAVYVEGTFNLDDVKKSISEMGYEVV